MINYLFEEGQFEEALKSTAKVLKSFIDSADTLIGDVLSEMNWTMSVADNNSQGTLE